MDRDRMRVVRVRRLRVKVVFGVPVQRVLKGVEVLAWQIRLEQSKARGFFGFEWLLLLH